MKHHRAVSFLGAAAVAAAIASPGLAQTATAVWACEDGQTFRASYDDRGVMLKGDGASYTLRQARSGSGVRYEAEGVEFHEKGTEAVMTFPGGGTVKCTRRSLQRAAQESSRETTRFPVDGKSYGGILRAGPGKEFRRVGSLREGQSVRITSNTRVRWNGYDWFGVGSGGRRGFQWGGLLCSKERKIEGIYKQCE